MIDARTQALLATAAPLHGATLHDAIGAALAELVGYRLLTLLRLEGPILRRAWTSAPDQYPPGGGKDVRDDPWLQHLLAAPGPVLSANLQEVRERFPDHAAIEALGCGAVLNVPVRQHGKTLGSLNLLHEEGWFQPGHAAVAQGFARLLGADWERES